jgi:hypothetical protein
MRPVTSQGKTVPMAARQEKRRVRAKDKYFEIHVADEDKILSIYSLDSKSVRFRIIRLFVKTEQDS